MSPFERKTASKTLPQRQTYELARQRYYAHLLNEQRASNPFPHSSLRRNVSLYNKHPEIEFIRVLDPYILDTKLSDWETCEYGIWGKSDVGHKLHLNIQPHDVQDVSAYLKRAGFNHKYLSGGDPGKGKVFTLYPGSNTKAHQMALQLSQDLDSILCRPLDRNEVEYAPNVSGRFTERGLTFHKDGARILRGIPMLFSDLEILEDEHRQHLIDASWVENAFERSFMQLATTYGPYFFGE